MFWPHFLMPIADLARRARTETGAVRRTAIADITCGPVERGSVVVCQREGNHRDRKISLASASTMSVRRP